MPADEPLVASLARAVLDGTHVDWEAAESGAIADTQPVVQELRVLADLAAVHRQAAAPMPELARLMSALTTDRLPPDLSAEWGHLTILEPIGRGAGGVVYRARDPRLDRDVALKLLPAPLSDERAASTIIEEGRLLARVRHPNVVTIHGAEQIGDQIGLWMELVHGRTLEDLLGARAPFSAADVSDIGLQLCGAVSAVHDAGLLHRDIKATNVVRADDGRVVLMDFGTGRDAGDSAASDLTGTPLYLAPEVFRGEPATVQSDIYSLGVVLYHLATGAYPVQGASIGDVRHAHERSERRSLRAARPGLPAGFVRVVERAIDPNPAARYRTAAEMGAALRAAVRRRGPSRRTLIAAAVLAVAAAGVAWSVRGRIPSPTASAAAGPPRLAVLPFATLGSAGGDDDAFGLGLAHEIQRNLARLEGLVLLSFTSTSAVPTAQPIARDVRAELHADLILDGSVVRQDGTLRVHARLARAAGDAELWSDTFDRRDTEVFAILDEIAGAIVNELRLNLRLPRRHETSPETFFLFIRGRAFEARRHETDALEAARLFQQVVDKDPLFAPAWAGLASALAEAYRVRVGDQDQPPDPRMEAAARKAIELDELLAPAQAAMGNVYAERRDWPRAEAAFLRALELNPSLTTTHTDYALSVLMPLDRNQGALHLLAEAVSRDPASLDVRRLLAHFQVNAGLYEDAMVSSRWVLARDATFPWASLWLGRALALSGRPEDAVPIFAANPNYWAYLGYAYGVMGRRAEAEALAAAHPDDPRGQMMIYSALGDRDRAIDALERLASRNPWRAATWLHRPEMAPIRSDPRVGAIKARLGLDP